ncbi:MAG: signal peptidase II [Candidatus Cloacimonadaceae bacterium]
MELIWMREKQTVAARQFRYLWLAAVIILLDQLVKIVVKLNLPLYESKQILGELVMLTHVQNTGAAFSISLGSPEFNRIFFIIMTVLAVVFVLYMIYRSNTKLQRIALSMVVGGAIGNVIDRILFGYVTDFVDVDFPNIIMQRWPVFNVADSSIVIAMGLLILDAIINKDAGEEKAPAEIND